MFLLLKWLFPGIFSGGENMGHRVAAKRWSECSYCPCWQQGWSWNPPQSFCWCRISHLPLLLFHPSFDSSWVACTFPHLLEWRQRYLLSWDHVVRLFGDKRVTPFESKWNWWTMDIGHDMFVGNLLSVRELYLPPRVLQSNEEWPCSQIARPPCFFHCFSFGGSFGLGDAPLHLRLFSCAPGARRLGFWRERRLSAAAIALLNMLMRRDLSGTLWSDPKTTLVLWLNLPSVRCVF